MPFSTQPDPTPLPQKKGPPSSRVPFRLEKDFAEGLIRGSIRQRHAGRLFAVAFLFRTREEGRYRLRDARQFMERAIEDYDAQNT